MRLQFLASERFFGAKCASKLHYKVLQAQSVSPIQERSALFTVIPREIELETLSALEHSDCESLPN